MCELHPRCMSPPIARLSSAYDHACSTSIHSSSLESSNCSVTSSNSGTETPNSSVDTHYTVQSEKILQKCNFNEAVKQHCEDVNNRPFTDQSDFIKLSYEGARCALAKMMNAGITETSRLEEDPLVKIVKFDAATNTYKTVQIFDVDDEINRIKNIEKSSETNSSNEVTIVLENGETTEKEDVTAEQNENEKLWPEYIENESGEQDLHVDGNNNAMFCSHQMGFRFPGTKENCSIEGVNNCVDTNNETSVYEIDSSLKQNIGNIKGPQFISKMKHEAGDGRKIVGCPVTVNTHFISIPQDIVQTRSHKVHQHRHQPGHSRVLQPGYCVEHKGRDNLVHQPRDHMLPQQRDHVLFKPVDNMLHQSEFHMAQKRPITNYVIPKPSHNNYSCDISSPPPLLHTPQENSNKVLRNSKPDIIRKKLGQLHCIPAKSLKIKQFAKSEDIEMELNKLRVKRKIKRLSSEPVRMYKISGMRPNLIPSSTEPELQAKDLLPMCNTRSYGMGLLSNLQSRTEKSGNTVKTFSCPCKSCSSKLRKTSVPKPKNKEESKTVNESVHVLADIDSDTMLLSPVDCRLTSSGDIFSTELWSHPFPSNLLDGDGFNKDPDFDPDLEQIENDIFELQDKYPAPTSAFSSMPIDSRVMLPTGSGSLLHTSVATSLIPNSTSLQHGVVDTSMPSITTTNIQQGTIPLLVAEENVNVLLSGQHVPSSINAMQVNVQTGIMPLMTTDCVNIPQVSGVQMLTSPVKAPHVSVDQMLSIPGQGSIQQAPIQVSQSVLQAIQQATGGVALNEGAQNALLQQLTAIVNNRQSNQQIGVQNSSVVNNFQHMNQSLITLPGTQLSYTPSPLRTQSLPVALQPSQQNIEVQSVSQLSGVCNVQNTNLGHVQMELVSENEVFNANNSYSANFNEMATKLVKSDSVEFNNDYMNDVCLANTVDNITSSNIALLNPTGTVNSGNIPHTSLLLNLTGTEAMDTSLDASASMMKTTDQSVENQDN